MKINWNSLNQGLENSLVRAIIAKDCAAPLMGMSEADLVGNLNNPTDFWAALNLKAVKHGKEIEACKEKFNSNLYLVTGPYLKTNNLMAVTCHESRTWNETANFQFIAGAALLTALTNDLFNVLNQEYDHPVYDSDQVLINTANIFSTGISFNPEESSRIRTGGQVIKIIEANTEIPLPLAGTGQVTSAIVMIGSDWKNAKEKSVRLLGWLADGEVSDEERNRVLLDEFNVDLSRTQKEDYEFLERLYDYELKTN